MALAFPSREPSPRWLVGPGLADPPSAAHDARHMQLCQAGRWTQRTVRFRKFLQYAKSGPQKGSPRGTVRGGWSRAESTGGRVCTGKPSLGGLAA